MMWYAGTTLVPPPPGEELWTGHLSSTRVSQCSSPTQYQVHDNVELALTPFPFSLTANRPVFEKLYSEVRNGNETRRSLSFNGQKDYREKFAAETAEIDAQEIWRAGKTVRKLRVSAKGRYKCWRIDDSSSLCMVIARLQGRHLIDALESSSFPKPHVSYSASMRPIDTILYNILSRIRYVLTGMRVAYSRARYIWA